VSLRSDVADHLRARLPGFKVLAYQYEMDNSTMPVVMVHRSRINPHPDRHVLWENTLTVKVLSPQMVGEAAEDAADDALRAVLGALQDLPEVQWTEAERATFANFIGYDVTVTFTSYSELEL